MGGVDVVGVLVRGAWVGFGVVVAAVAVAGAALGVGGAACL